MPFVVGVLLAIGIAALAKLTRFDEDRSFYSTVLIIIASYYVLFAVLGGSIHALAWELIIAVAFSTVAILGALFLPALVGMGIIAHGLFDLVHNSILENSGVPTWWPTFCGSIDVLLGLWVLTITHSRRKVCVSLLMGLSAATLGACAEEQGKSYWLRHATVTLAQAAQIAETSGSGRAVEAELRQSGTRVFYEIEIVDKVNRPRNIRVDAETGRVIKHLTLP
jgi:Peptidase propeptide and YPEB domain